MLEQKDAEANENVEKKHLRGKRDRMQKNLTNKRAKIVNLPQEEVTLNKKQQDTENEQQDECIKCGVE